MNNVYNTEVTYQDGDIVAYKGRRACMVKGKFILVPDEIADDDIAAYAMRAYELLAYHICGFDKPTLNPFMIDAPRYIGHLIDIKKEGTE